MDSQPNNQAVTGTVADASLARSIDLKIPVAVFTAKRGYDWSQLPVFVSQDEADKLYEEVGAIRASFSVELSLGDVFKGIILKPNYAFAFRLQIVEKWDQVKRDANYCAAAFVPIENLADVDFGRLLDMDYFTMPSRMPAAILNYTDEDYAEPGQEAWQPILQNLVDEKYDDFSWSLIGPMLSQCRTANSSWTFVRMVCKSEMRHKIVLGQWDYGAPCFEQPEPTEQPEDIAQSVQTTTAVVQSEQGQLFQPQQIESQTPIENPLKPQLEAAESKICELEKEKLELERKLANQIQTVQNACAGRDAAMHEAGKYRLQLQQYDSVIPDIKSTESKIEWLRVAIAFLVGVLFAGVLFLLINFALPSNSHASSRNEQAHESQVLNGLPKSMDGIKK